MKARYIPIYCNENNEHYAQDNEHIYKKCLSAIQQRIRNKMGVIVPKVFTRVYNKRYSKFKNNITYVWRYIAEKVFYKNTWIKVNYYETMVIFSACPCVSVSDRVRMKFVVGATQIA